MTADRKSPRPLPLAGQVGFAILGLGLIGAVVLADWRVAIIGVIAGVLVAVVFAPRDPAGSRS